MLGLRSQTVPPAPIEEKVAHSLEHQNAKMTPEERSLGAVVGAVEQTVRDIKRFSALLRHVESEPAVTALLKQGDVAMKPQAASKPRLYVSNFVNIHGGSDRAEVAATLTKMQGILRDLLAVKGTFETTLRARGLYPIAVA